MNRPVRVCFMIDKLSPAGTETQLVAVIRNLNRDRVQPYLCLLDGTDELSRALEPEGCPVLRLAMNSLARPRSVVQALRLARFLRREQIDILQAYFTDSTYFGVPVGRLAGVPYIIRTRNNSNYWMTPTHRRIGRLLNHLVSATITNSESGRRALLADECPRPETVIVLENGVDLHHFRAIPPIDPARWRSGCRVGVVANLRPVKGLEVFVEAAARVGAAYPDVTFWIAGEGELRPELERQVAKRGLVGRLALPGSVADIPGFLAELDVAVQSSHSEGMPNAVLEYMAAGRPIVATTVGGTTQLIEDEVHGLLVPPDDPARLAGAIDRLLRAPGLAERLGAAARQRAQEHFSREKMVRRLEDLYQDIVGRRVCAS